MEERVETFGNVALQHKWVFSKN